MSSGDSWFASVRTAELMMQHGLHFVGDVKTGTRRFPMDALKESTPQENGAWSTCTSSLQLGDDRIIPIYAVSHRRGESIHGFISTCGTTLSGDSVHAYFEDDEERCNAECADYALTRKAPRICNDFTLAQPVSDRHNRYRQVRLLIRVDVSSESVRLRRSLHHHPFFFRRSSQWRSGS